MTGSWKDGDGAEQKALDEATKRAADAIEKPGREINAAQQQQPGPNEPHLEDSVEGLDGFESFDKAKRDLDRAAAAEESYRRARHYEDPTDGGDTDEVTQNDINIEDHTRRKFAPQVFVSKVGGNPITIDECMSFLALYAERGIWNDCAYELGRSGKAFRDKAREDPVFAVMVGEAAQDWREKLQAEVIRRGYRGYLEPVFAGKEGEHVGYIRKFSDRLLQMELEAAWPDRYRPGHKAQADLNLAQTSGVMVVPGVASSVQEWKDAIAKRPQSLSLQKVTRPIGGTPKKAE